ncbi:hypothetical protein CTZ27_24995 [Streptomyces griseocarneus]|nr:hypothetical protein CTZ27_24995 [Streptomyces griseocarneus]
MTNKHSPDDGTMDQNGAASTGDPVGAIIAQVAASHGQDRPLSAAPVLALGIFERVGSNWLSDSLRPVMLTKAPAAGRDNGRMTVLSRHH